MYLTNLFGRLRMTYQHVEAENVNAEFDLQYLQWSPAMHLHGDRTLGNATFLQLLCVSTLLQV